MTDRELLVWIAVLLSIQTIRSIVDAIVILIHGPLWKQIKEIRK